MNTHHCSVSCYLVQLFTFDTYVIKFVHVNAFYQHHITDDTYYKVENIGWCLRGQNKRLLFG